MKKLEILGTGCPKCKKLYAVVDTAAKATGVAYTIEKVEDLARIMEYGVMMTPALVVDGKVVASGKLLTPNEVTSFIQG